MMDILSAGLFTDTVKALDIRFSQSLANFITGAHFPACPTRGAGLLPHDLGFFQMWH